MIARLLAQFGRQLFGGRRADRLSKPTSRHDESARVLTFRRILQILGQKEETPV